MKKIIFILIMFLIFPLFSAAVDYDIEQFYINAEVQENGDMKVSELILLDGTFNGYERDIKYFNSYADSNLNASNLTDIKVYAKSTNSITFDTFNEEFTEFQNVSYANNGDKGKYITSTISGGYRLRMYYETNNSKTAFLITYTLKDVVIMHNDFAEIYWNFIGNEFEDTLKDVQILVSLPGKDDSQYFYHWVHGYFTGESSAVNEETTKVLAKIAENPKYEALDVRITFDKSLVNSSEIQKYSSQTLDDIFEYEQKLYEENEVLRKEVKRKWNIALGGTIIFYIFLVSGFIYVYIKYDKERKSQFTLKYNREFIDDYNVEVVDYLMNHKITENALSASIMNLIYKKNIKVEAIADKKDSYTFTLLNRDNLNETENSLVDFLFTTVGDGTTFTTEKLKSYASSTVTCQRFMSSYTNWKNKVIKDGQNQEFFENRKNYIWLPFLLLFYSIILQYYISSNNIELPIAFFGVIFAILFLVYSLTCTKKTKKGVEHYSKWKALKNFLNDFGNFSVKELPEIILWERYLVYATVFGLADKVEKAMNVKIKEFENVDSMDFYMYNNLYNIHMASIISSSMHSAINSSQVTINRITASSSSGSNGFGGGFSGGGGFGGGGGGGRGF